MVDVNTDTVNTQNNASIPGIKLGTYRHNKSGKTYEVIGVALDTETNVFMVAYRPLYRTEDGISMFVRPYDMFVANVEINGNPVPRFEKIDD